MSVEVKKFNILLEEFLEKLISKFESDKLKTYRRSFIMLKETSPIIPVNNPFFIWKLALSIIFLLFSVN